MLAKCINPNCQENFRYLESGRLFRLEPDPWASPPRNKIPEYFWLCRHCAARMTLRIDIAQGIHISESIGDDPPDSDSFSFVLLERKYGLVLNGISFDASRMRRQERTAKGGQTVYA